MRLTCRVIELCEATKGGRRCERETGHDPARHWYTVWSHPNQYGSYPSYPVMWGDAP